MASPLALLLLLLLAVATVSETAALGAANSDLQWMLTRTAEGDAGLTNSTPACHGSVGECADGESDMESEESTRRFLAAKGRQKFISYDVLNKNRVPCNRRGQSYYNCQRSRQANPYRRGCSAITNCARQLD